MAISTNSKPAIYLILTCTRIQDYMGLLIAPTIIVPTIIAPTIIAPTIIAPTTIVPTIIAPTTIVPTIIGAGALG